MVCRNQINEVELLHALNTPINVHELYMHSAKLSSTITCTAVRRSMQGLCGRSVASGHEDQMSTPSACAATGVVVYSQLKAWERRRISCTEHVLWLLLISLETYRPFGI